VKNKRSFDSSLYFVRSPQTHNLFIGLVISVNLALSCCKNDDNRDACGSQTSTIGIDPNDLSRLPYSGKDTLVFTSNANDTFTCIGAGRVPGEICKDVTSNPACPPMTVQSCYENFSVVYKDNSKNFTLGYAHYSNYPDYHFNGSIQDLGESIVISCRTNIFYLFPASVFNLPNSSTFASRQFNGKLYHNVTCCLNNINNPGDTLFFTRTEGIVHFTLNNGTERYTRE
jgi:hypothetical protein